MYKLHLRFCWIKAGNSSYFAVFALDLHLGKFGAGKSSQMSSKTVTNNVELIWIHVVLLGKETNTANKA